MELLITDKGSAEKLAAKLRFGARQAENTETLIDKILLDMLRVEERVFASEGRRGGGSWKRLSPDTVRKKGTSQILRTNEARSGYSSFGDDTLYRSVTEVGAPFQILRTTKRTITFGTFRPYASLQQSGGRHIPRRPFLRFLPTDVDRWRKMLAEHLMQSFVQK